MTSKLITKETANLIITVYIMYTVLIFLLSIYIDTGFNFINYSLKYLEQLYQFAEKHYISDYIIEYIILILLIA